MKKRYIYLAMSFFIIILFLIFKPVKVSISLIVPESLEGLNFIIKSGEKEFLTSNKNIEIWLFPGKKDIEIKFNNNKIKKELEVPYFLLLKKEYKIFLPEPQMNVHYERKEYNQILIYFNSRNYKMDYWEIHFNREIYKTTSNTYKLFISPYDEGVLKVIGYIQNKKIYEKDFGIESPISGIKDYKLEIRDYIIISFEIEHKKIDPIKYEIYKNEEHIEDIENNIYRDKFSHEEIKYSIVPIYPSGYKGKKIEIIKPKLPEIQEKLNKRNLDFNMKYEEILLNGKKYDQDNFVEGENTLIIKINDRVTWYKKIYFDSTPPKLIDYSLKYDGQYKLTLISNEKAKYKLITDEREYFFDEEEFEFKTFSKEATLIVFDDLSNESSPVKVNLDPFPKYEIKEYDNGVSFKFNNNFIADFCELKVIDEENTLVTKIDVKKLGEFTFSSFRSGKEYKFILYIDDDFQKEIYNKITKPQKPIVKYFNNVEVGEFELILRNDYKYNYYSIDIGKYNTKGYFSGSKNKFNIPLEYLTEDGTLTIWREFRGIKTSKIKIKIKDKFLYGKKLYDSLKGIIKEEKSPYIVYRDIDVENLKIEGKVEVYVFPGKNININGNMNFFDKYSKVVFKPVKNDFNGIILNTKYLKNIEIYGAKIGVYVNSNFDLYNLTIKNCEIGIYDKEFSGRAYNVLISGNLKGIESIDSNIEIKNSLLFDNEKAFSFYKTKSYLYNLYIADSKIDIEATGSHIEIKVSNFLNSAKSIESFHCSLSIKSSIFRNVEKAINSIEDENMWISKSSFIKNQKAINIFNSDKNRAFIIENTVFEQNEMDIYIEGNNDIYLKNTEITKFLDGSIAPTWINEENKSTQRGKIIFEGGNKK